MASFGEGQRGYGEIWPPDGTTEWYASPVENPPVVVFAEEPTVRKTGGKEWQIQIPMRWQNLAGAVEVVLHAGSSLGAVARPEPLPDQSEHDVVARQLTGCTSPKTMIPFTLAETSVRPRPGAHWTDVYVLDAWGSVLARADLPKLPH
jgi:hypothetical protein